MRHQIEKGGSIIKKDISEEKQKHLETLGQNLRRIRTERQMSQEQLANLCGHTNANARSWISKIEKGVNDISVSELKQLSKALGVTCVDLITEDAAEGKKEACELLEQCHSSDVFKVVQQVIRLDQEDRLVIYGEALGMLRADKYRKKEKDASGPKAM